MSARGWRRSLYARAMVLEEASTQRRIAYVVCDLGMISESIRQEVSRRICTADNLLTDHDLMITATHTHSGPGGFSTYLFFAISIPGVSVRVHDEIVDGIVAAIEARSARARPARAWLHAGWIPISEPVAFNRSLDAYNRNEDVTPLPGKARRGGRPNDDRPRVEDEHGVPMGMFSWFPVHGTSLHWDQSALHGDNKGHAAQVCETWGREQGYPGLRGSLRAGIVRATFRPTTAGATPAAVIGRYDDDHAERPFQRRHAGPACARPLRARTYARAASFTGPLDSASGIATSSIALPTRDLRGRATHAPRLRDSGSHFRSARSKGKDRSSRCARSFPVLAPPGVEHAARITRLVACPARPEFPFGTSDTARTTRCSWRAAGSEPDVVLVRRRSLSSPITGRRWRCLARAR